MTNLDLLLMELDCSCYLEPLKSTCGNLTGNESACVCANQAIEAEGAQLPP